jgi:hypothetical protein
MSSFLFLVEMRRREIRKGEGGGGESQGEGEGEEGKLIDRISNLHSGN